MFLVVILYGSETMVTFAMRSPLTSDAIELFRSFRLLGSFGGVFVNSRRQTQVRLVLFLLWLVVVVVFLRGWGGHPED